MDGSLSLDDMLEAPDLPKKRGRGRPPGVKNRQALPPAADRGPREVPPGYAAMDDYRHADPLALISRNYAMLDWAQQALRIEMKVGLGARGGTRVSAENISKLGEISASLMRMLEGHKKALVIAEELSKQKTPAEMLEIAIKKIEGQDLPTLQAVIRRLREHRSRLAPISKRDSKMMTGIYKTAVSEVAALDLENDSDIPDAE